MFGILVHEAVLAARATASRARRLVAADRVRGRSDVRANSDELVLV
jgi:hypothetical protein